MMGIKKAIDYLNEQGYDKEAIPSDQELAQIEKCLNEKED